MYKKVHWVANSRVNTVDEEMLKIMKKAGCWLVAFGFESGSQRSLDLMKKGTTVEQNIYVCKLAKKVGLQVFGFYLIGFPWENYDDLKLTKKLIFKLNADFIELHIATPFYKTSLYDIVKKKNLIDGGVLGKDCFNFPTKGSKYLSIQEIQKFRSNVLLMYHLRPSFILKKLELSWNKPKILKQYFLFGTRLFKDCIKKVF